MVVVQVYSSRGESHIGDFEFDRVPVVGEILSLPNDYFEVIRVIWWHSGPPMLQVRISTQPYLR